MRGPAVLPRVRLLLRVRMRLRLRLAPARRPCWAWPAGVVDFDGPDWEGEAERLLQWSQALDFDAYLHDWVGIGTSSHTMLASKFRAAEGLYAPAPPDPAMDDPFGFGGAEDGDGAAVRPGDVDYVAYE
jgi:hypothetical protein